MEREGLVVVLREDLVEGPTTTGKIPDKAWYKVMMVQK